MRVFDKQSRKAVQQVIDAHRGVLEKMPGFVSAEPGFPIVNGKVLKEPAILVFVSHKKPPNHLLPEERMPRQLGEYRVSVMQADPLRQLAATSELEDVAAAVAASANNLTYEGIDGDPIDAVFTVTRPIVCHVGPDAGWPTLKPFLDATKKTLSVAMYDFNAEYIATSVIDLVRSKAIAMKLTWDNGMTADETAIRKKLRTKLADRLTGGIVQCGSGRRFASAYHEKVAVRDSKAFWLSSGNWSRRSQPDIDPLGDPADAKGMYAKGNREWHVIVEDKPLAQLYERYIQFDLDASLAEAEQGDAGAALSTAGAFQLPDVFVPIDTMSSEAIESAAPPQPVASAVLPDHGKSFKVRPLLSPDNYRARVVELLESAKRSVYLQFAYINYSDKDVDKDFAAMLAVLAALSYRPGMDVRIILGSNGAADKIRLLAEAGFKETVFRTQRNIHNKGIIVDGKAVLVSSANWSGDGVLRNRDAGLVIYDAQVAKYFRDVFIDDWENRATSQIQDDAPVTVASQDAATPPGMVRMTWRDYYG